MVRIEDGDMAAHVANSETQVLNKRKPVNLITQPPNVPDNTEVFVMKGTNEVFTDYEKYLKRFDWLNQKKFTDAVNGKSGLTYWDALESETKSSATIETLFPEVLRDPILRNVQFSTISRMDELVNKVFDDFKSDYFPGEDVVCTLEDREQFEGTIREKAKFPMIRGADGSVQRAPFSRYFVKVHGSPSEEALLDDKHIRRDRKLFTKQNLRAFLKNSLQRDSWSGAPWLVKEHLAIQYRLPMEIPQNLFQDAKLMTAKTQQLSMRPPKNKKPKGMPPAEYERLRLQEMNNVMHHQHQMQQQVPGAHPGQLNHYQQQQVHHQMMNQAQPRPPPAPVVKYPIEDLDLHPKRNGATRPELKFFTEELAEHIRGGRKSTVEGIQMKSIGMLLEVWNTLNVQCEVYVLDSFTFDDFVDAMQYQELSPPCELFEEIHCAVLKLFVDDKGKLLVKDMPRKKIEEPPADDDTEMQDDSEVSTPLPDVPARSTRSRLSHMEVAEPDSPTVENRNRAAEMLGDRPWEDRLAARDFTDGGWQIIIIGILHQLSQVPLFKERCEKILAHLAPIDAKPAPDTAIEQYASMDINLKITALQLLTVLTIRTDAIKDFLETCMDDMTDVRKRKIEHQREKKLAMEEFAIKDREFKILRPDHMPASPEQEPTEVTERDLTEDSIDLNGNRSSEDPDDAAIGRSLRRAGDRKRKREEEQARREKEKAAKAEAAKAHNKAAKEFKKIEKECLELKERIKVQEEKIAECDSDLREANVQRTKVLGKDRFCNRYYWFERNGQPFGGLPSSSTASYGYANGRIWVQGPDVMGREGFIDRNPEQQKEYQRYFQMTVPERRNQEEGEIQLNTAEEWGYIDDPDRLDNLIGWLDDRGERERKLRKELTDWRDRIAQYMEAYKNFLDQETAKKLETESEHETRVSTRHKQAEEAKTHQARCLRWTNSMAQTDEGHIHSQPPKPKEKKSHKKQVVEDRGRGVAVPVNRKK